MGLLDGKVAIITGAGGGLGEAYAKLFAREGAAVVVNDLGGARDGSGEGAKSAAQKVADAIIAEGGRAVANGDDVSTMQGGENIAKTARKIESRSKFEPLTLLPAMAELASAMVHDVLTAYAARDAALAAQIVVRDEKVDAFYDSIFRNLVSHMIENPASITTAAELLFVARNIERIGDHATNIAEMVYFAATGTYLTDREDRTGA